MSMIYDIRQESEPEQWRHIRSELNPADYASRGIQATETNKLERWKRGPEFLWKDVDKWPLQPEDLTDSLQETDERVKKEKITVGAATVRTNFWNLLFQQYSTWDRLRRVVAWLIRAFRRPVRAQTQSKLHGNSKEDAAKRGLKPLSVSELEEAEKRIVRFVQRESFVNEIEKTAKRGQLARLKPFEEEGILRVGGRLGNASLSYAAKHPFILPKNHPVSALILRHYHHLNGHVGTYQVLAATRERFWIVNGASSIRSVFRKCHVYRRENAKLGEQVTAPLPVVRVSSDSYQMIYPFAAVGLDYFGPLYVKSGPSTRSRGNTTLNKRYGCIFMCLRYRAVHIEVADTLSTDGFINAVLRFVGRRGPPRVLYSDNGTNFRGTELHVLKALERRSREKSSCEDSRGSVSEGRAKALSLRRTIVDLYRERKGM